jgi:hypothetical protein
MLYRRWRKIHKHRQIHVLVEILFGQRNGNDRRVSRIVFVEIIHAHFRVECVVAEIITDGESEG